ncbi:hypothetical protein AB0L97_36710 [Nocardia sp. NPDC051911]|uniref:hypothetical protein n=1 Tax=Nocardia sp. NPDC051911 TaxID=3154648 RepID=UPI003421168A
MNIDTMTITVSPVRTPAELIAAPHPVPTPQPSRHMTALAEIGSVPLLMSDGGTVDLTVFAA